MSPQQITYNESDLVQLLRQQSKEAFDYLYRQYAPVLNGVICKVIADEQTSQDVLQDVFVKIWSNIGQYDPVKGRIFTWMLHIARNTAIDRLRSKGEIMKSRIRTGDHVSDAIEKGMHTVQVTDTIGLRKVIESLKPEFITILDLAYFKGFTMEEISRNLGIPVGTVKTRMRSAIRQLRSVFDQ